MAACILRLIQQFCKCAQKFATPLQIVTFKEKQTNYWTHKYLPVVVINNMALARHETAAEVTAIATVCAASVGFNVTKEKRKICIRPNAAVTQSVSFPKHYSNTHVVAILRSISSDNNPPLLHGISKQHKKTKYLK